MKVSHPLPVGAHVHHQGSRWNYWWDEDDCRERPSSGWATVIRIKSLNDGTPYEYPDGSFEYEVRYDRPLVPEGSETGWWASYHIDAHHRLPLPVAVSASPTSLPEEGDHAR